VAAFAAATICSSVALAQTAAEPGQVERRLRPKPPEPTLGPPINVPATPEQQAPKGQESLRFNLSRVIFAGNTVISDARLQVLASEYAGKKITLGQVYELAGKVTVLYRNAGYILARALVPAQRIDNGVLTIRIVEGFVDKVDIQGATGATKALLEEYGERIAAQRPLTASVLERELLLASDLGGVHLRSVLTPSAATPGGADLTLIVSYKEADAYLSVDNLGSEYLGPNQITYAVFGNNLFGTAGRVGLTAVMTPDSGPELGYGALSIDQPIGSDGFRLYGTLSYTRTRPGRELALLHTKGRAFTGDLTLSYPFIRSRDLNLIGSLDFTSRDVESENFAVSPLFRDHIRTLGGNVYVNLLDAWAGYSTLSLSVTHGLNILGATTSSDPDKSRVGAGSDYWRANFEVSRHQPLFSRLGLLVAAAGQTSFNEPLLASEQFALGGTNFDRGFDPSEVTGDAALAGRAELQFDAYTQPGFITGVQPYGFYEGGAVWQAKALPGTPKHESLTSAGFGVRFTIADRLHADVSWAKPFERNVTALGNRDARVFFSVGMSL